MAEILSLTTLLLALLVTSQLEGQKFDGKVESFAFDVKATPAGGAISSTPPKADIKDGDGKVDYAKTDSILVVPPITNQVLAIVESLHSKLDVKGPYAKWNPKLHTEKITVHHILSPRLMPLKHKGEHLVSAPKIKAIRRNKAVSLSRSPFRKMHRKSLFKKTTGTIPSRSKIGLTKGLKSNHRIRESLYDTNGPRARLNVPEEDRAFSKKEDTEKYLSSKERRVSRREASDPDDLSKSIEALIADSLKKRQKSLTETNDSPNGREKIQARKYTKISLKRKLLNEKIKELGSPEVKKYMKGVTSRVSHVVSEAKSVLQDTGKIVRRIKKVITGAKLLTEFTKNAVKFAKYFAMEPSNATVDYFEEKAVMAVLEAQKAAAESKIAAVEAKNSAKRVKDLLHKFEKKTGSKAAKKASRLIKYAEGESHRAGELARMTSQREKNARQKAVIVDKALRKMLKLANEEAKSEEVKGEEVKGEEVKGEEVKGDEVKGEEVQGEEVQNEEGKIEGTSKQNLEESEKRNESKGVKTESKKVLKNEGMKQVEEDEERKVMEKLEGKEEQENEEERLKMKAIEDIQKKAHDEITWKGFNNGDEEGSGTEASSHNTTTENGSSSKNTLEAMNGTSNNSNNSKAEGIEGAELPELLHEGGDGNEVVANDFEQEGFSIPGPESRNSEAEKEIANVLDKLTDGKATQNDKLQQILKTNNDTSQNLKSSSKESNESKDKKYATADNGGKEVNEIQSHDEGEAITTENEEEEEGTSFNTAPAIKEKLHAPMAVKSVFKNTAPKETSFRTTQSGVIERKVETIDRGPVNLVVTVTRRKVNKGNKTSGRSVKEEGLEKNEGKTLGQNDAVLYDPFNFKGLETQEYQKSSKGKFIVDKEDQGRAGIANSYEKPKDKTTESSLSKKYNENKERSMTSYDSRPTDFVTQV